MKILIDIDDTISNFGEVLLKWLNLENETNYKKEDIDNWEWFRQKFNDPWKPTEYKRFWQEVKIDKDAIKCIENLVIEGHEIYLVTASFPSDTLGYKIRKTLSNFNENLINKNNVIVCYNKGMIQGDVRIDDGFHNLYNNSLNILYTQPWNENHTNDIEFIRRNNFFIRKNNWNDIYNLIEIYNIVLKNIKNRDVD